MHTSVPLTLGHTESVVLRPLGPRDVEAVIALVRSHEFASEHPPEVLRRLFQHGWSPDREDMGFVLQAGSRIVGVICAVYSTRPSPKGPVRWGNMSTWYVEAPYRSHSLGLLKALCAQRDIALTNLSASADVSMVLNRFGFKPVVTRRHFLHRWSAGLKPWLSRHQVLDDPQIIEQQLTPELRKVFSDHRGYDLGHYLVLCRSQMVYVVTKRGTIKGQEFLPAWWPKRLLRRRYPVSNAIFVSDPPAASSCWHSLRDRVVRRERTLALTVYESMAGGLAPASTMVRSAIYIRPPAGAMLTPNLAVDGLYSEFVLLPFS